jgi:hypothetical protein
MTAAIGAAIRSIVAPAPKAKHGKSKVAARDHSSTEPVNALASALTPSRRFPVVMPVLKDQERMCDRLVICTRDEADACGDGAVQHTVGGQTECYQHDAFHAEPYVARIQAPALE